jgi:hypothetical protein
MEPHAIYLPSYVFHVWEKSCSSFSRHPVTLVAAVFQSHWQPVKAITMLSRDEIYSLDHGARTKAGCGQKAGECLLQVERERRDGVGTGEGR